MVAHARAVPIALLVLASALACDDKQAPVRVITGPYASQMTYGVAVHDRFEVRLRGTAEGWQWQPAAAPSYVAQRGEATVAGGTTTFTFEATAPGEEALRFEYVRASQPDGEPAQTFVVALRVK